MNGIKETEYRNKMASLGWSGEEIDEFIQNGNAFEKKFGFYKWDLDFMPRPVLRTYQFNADGNLVDNEN